MKQICERCKLKLREGALVLPVYRLVQMNRTSGLTAVPTEKFVHMICPVDR